jgi:hypothetical protein
MLSLELDQILRLGSLNLVTLTLLHTINLLRTHTKGGTRHTVLSQDCSLLFSVRDQFQPPDFDCKKFWWEQLGIEG